MVNTEVFLNNIESLSCFISSEKFRDLEVPLNYSISRRASISGSFMRGLNLKLSIDFA